MTQFVRSRDRRRAGSKAFGRELPGCALFFLLLIAVPAAGQQPVSQQSGDLSAAAAAERSGKYEDAARDYQNFLSSAGPASPAGVIQVRTHLATALFMLHRYRESLDVLAPLRFPPNSGPKVEKSGEPQAVAIPAQAWLVRGLDEVELNKLPEAIQSLHEALALNPASGTARLALGDALARSGRLEEAAETYRQQLDRDPKTPDAWFKLGSVYEELSGKLSAEFAREQPNQLLEIQLSAEQLLDRGDYWGAAKALFPVSQTGPPSPGFQPGLHATFGTALLQLGYPRAAEREFKAELSQDPASLPAGLGMAEIDTLQSNWDAAIGIFGRLMAADPKELARALESAPATPVMQAAQDRRLSAPPQVAGSPAGKLWSEWIASKGLESPAGLESAAGPCSSPPSSGERTPGFWMSEGCLAGLRQGLGSQKGLPVSKLTELAEADYRLGDYSAAAEDGRALLRQSARDPWAYYWLVKSYSALAGDSFDKLAEVSPDSARVHEILARYHSERQQLAAARNEYEAALRLEPGLADLELGLGTVDWQAGDWTRAEAELSKALEMSPGSAVGAYELGDCFVQQHQWQSAASPLEHALSDPGVGRRARLDLAKVETELGDLNSAIRNLLVLAPGDSDGEVHYRLAMLYRKVGESAKAEEALARSEALRKASDQLGQSQIEALEHASGDAQAPDHAPGGPK